ncbi:hypothetical protein AX14_006065 [Amanita brunnescens Koide BX004]|nr:hypothetical protein AX14_006065 [Amanita brunnescens Koide BX004]
MGEKRLAYDTVVKTINSRNTIPPVPEDSAALTSLPTPSSTSTQLAEVLRVVPNEPVSTPTVKQLDLIAAISKDDKTSVNKYLPEAKVAPTLPIHPPALHMQTTVFRRPLDEAPPVKVLPEWQKSIVISRKRLASNTRSPTSETARKQLEAVKMPSVGGEGIYLQRAAAYVQERRNRRSLACDMFAPRTRKAPPDKMLGSDARRDSQDIVSENVSGIALRSPCANTVFTPLVPGPDCPSASVYPASPNNEARQAVQIVNKGDKASMKSSPEVEHKGLSPVKIPEGKRELLVEAVNDGCSNKHPPRYGVGPTFPAPVNPKPPDETLESEAGRQVVAKTTSTTMRSPDAIAGFSPQVPDLGPRLPLAYDSPAGDPDAENRPTATRNTLVDKAEDGLHALQVVNEGIEASLTCSPEDESERAEALSFSPSEAVPGQPEHSSSLPLVGKQGLRAGAANTKRSNERSSCCQAPAHSVPANPEPPDPADVGRPGRQAISGTGLSILLYLPKPAAAPMPLTHTPIPVNLFNPVYSPPRSSSALEFRLHWKPPDNGEDSQQNACHTINDRLQPGAARRLPLPGAAAALSISRSSLAHVTQAVPRRLNRPPRWRVRNPSVGMETIRRHAVNVVSNSIRLSVNFNVRSPTREAAIMLPNLPLTSPTRPEDASRTSTEFVWRARCKPPDTIQQRSAGIVNADSYMSTERSPLHEVALVLPVRILASSTRAINPHCSNNELAGRVRKLLGATGYWLLEEAVNKVEKGTWDCLPGSWRTSARSPAVVSLLTSSAQVTETRRWKDEPAWRVLKLPEVTMHWLLDEAVNKAGNGGIRGCSPIPRPKLARCAPSPPTFASFARSHSRTELASIICHCARETLVVLRTNRKGCYWPS